jgi:cytidine deaminase
MDNETGITMSNQPICFSDLSSEEQQLIDAAWEASKNAYCPYSNFPVGAAILTNEGKIFSGCNIENAAWTPSICSERVAASKAVSEGFRHFRSIAIVCAKKQGGWSCGLCRQFLSEFGLQLMVLNVVDENKSVLKKSIAELLPDSFGPHSL